MNAERRLRLPPIVRPLASPLARSARARSAWERAQRWYAVPPGKRRSFWGVSDARAVRMAYNVMLGREPDPVGEAFFRSHLHTRSLTRDQMVEHIRGSEEFNVDRRFTMLGHSIHAGRCDFIRGLPKAQRILDLGGTHQSKDVGALVALGYPYSFEELVIVDLPSDDRHELYQRDETGADVESPKGRVRYRYHSMVDLSAYESSSFDLVYSGQSIEHVTEDDADVVLKEVHRVLRPGGALAVDTPNGRVTRLQQAEFIDPDHKVEYTHEQFVAKLDAAGFDVIEAKGLNYAGASVAAGRFVEEDAAAHRGLFDDIESCYILTYLCRKPLPSPTGR